MPESPRDEIVELVNGVAAALEAIEPPEPWPPWPWLERYLGDVTDITFNGTDAERLALIARLLMLAHAAIHERVPDIDPSSLARRLERGLRRWEAGRRRGTVAPRPRPDELERHMAMFSAAYGPSAMIGVEIVAMSVAELVAVHALAGAVSVEEGVRSLCEIQQLVREAAALIGSRGSDLAPAVYEEPGATLAHLDQAAWQIERLLRHPAESDELRWLRSLWLEVVAVLVYAQDVYDGRGDHEQRWREVEQLAVDKMTTGELRLDPRGYDQRAALEHARSAALLLACLWLDESRGRADFPTVPMLEDRLIASCAQALLGAWAVEHELLARSAGNGDTSA